MNIFRSLRLLILALILSGCYPPIKGKVVDNISGQPLEGALVVAQWTREHGFGHTYHTLSLITETLTDKEGDFSINKISHDPFVEPPLLLIYKEGYNPWRNDRAFPAGRKENKFEWVDGKTYRLDLFTGKYTYDQLSNFIDSGIIGLSDVPIFHKIHRDISRRAFDEIDANKSKQKP